MYTTAPESLCYDYLRVFIGSLLDFRSDWLFISLYFDDTATLFHLLVSHNNTFQPFSNTNIPLSFFKPILSHRQPQAAQQMSTMKMQQQV